MANIKSQIKRNRQNQKRRLRNRFFRGGARAAVKEARAAINASAPESKERLLKAVSALDKAAERGVIHKNNAARRKSRLMRLFAKMTLARAEPPPPAAPPAEGEAPEKSTSRKQTAPKDASKEKKTEAKESPKKVEKKTAETPASKEKKPAEKQTAGKKDAEASSSKEKKPGGKK